MGRGVTRGGACLRTAVQITGAFAAIQARVISTRARRPRGVIGLTAARVQMIGTGSRAALIGVYFILTIAVFRTGHPTRFGAPCGAVTSGVTTRVCAIGERRTRGIRRHTTTLVAVAGIGLIISGAIGRAGAVVPALFPRVRARDGKPLRTFQARFTAVHPFVTRAQRPRAVRHRRIIRGRAVGLTSIGGRFRTRGHIAAFIMPVRIRRGTRAGVGFV